jgi:hypothetical protein
MTADGRRHVDHLCRRPDFAECPALGKGRFLSKAGLCRVLGTQQRLVCRVYFFAGCRWVWHSAKSAFAGCPIKNTQQRILHPANHPFPVVYEAYVQARMHYRLHTRYTAVLSRVQFIPIYKYRDKLKQEQIVMVVVQVSKNHAYVFLPIHSTTQTVTAHAHSPI